MSKKTIRIGAGAAWWGDRVEPAALNAERGALDYLCFETMAEATVSAAQVRARRDPSFEGYDTYLDDRMRAVLPACMANGTKIISNQGWINPDAAARRIVHWLREFGHTGVKVASVNGSLITDKVLSLTQKIMENRQPTSSLAPTLISAEAYLGAEPIVQALANGAQIVVTGRVADPSLTVGPAIAHFGWRADQWDALAGATMAGHLLECGAQVSGGYFADPGMKDVEGLHDVGFPIAEIAEDGSCIVTKSSRTGGLVDERTVKEQLLYELHDPEAYITPDVVADISTCRVTQVGPDRVRLSGVRGHPRTPTLKANVFFDGGWFGEGEISYAGPNAEARARLSMEIMRRRMGPKLPLRFDLIGIASILGDDGNRLLDAAPTGHATDIRLRVAGQHQQLEVIDLLLRELTALWTGGPAGGGGVRVAKRQRLSTQSCLIARERLPASFSFAAPLAA